MKKDEAKKELIDICKEINVLLDKKYIIFDEHGGKIPHDARFTFEEDAIYLTHNSNFKIFYLLSEDSETSTYGYNSYLREIRGAKKTIKKYKAVYPDNIISINRLLK